MMKNLSENKHSLWLMSGVPACGKTTKAKELLAAWPDTQYISRDEIRFSILQAEDEYFAKENDVFRKFVQAIQNSIDKHENTIADATFLNWASRNKLLKRLKGLNEVNVNILYFDTDLDTCLDRNSKREGRAKVPESVIRNMWNSRTHPNDDPFNYYIIGEVTANGESVFK